MQERFYGFMIDWRITNKRFDGPQTSSLFCFILMLHCKTALSGKRSRKSLEKQNRTDFMFQSARHERRSSSDAERSGKVEAGMEASQNDSLHRTNFRSHATSAITRPIYDRTVKSELRRHQCLHDATNCTECWLLMQTSIFHFDIRRSSIKRP